MTIFEKSLFLDLLKAYTSYSPVSPQGHPRAFQFHKFKSHTSRIQITIQNMHIMYKRKTYKHNPKVSPFGIALVKNGKQCYS